MSERLEHFSYMHQGWAVTRHAPSPSTDQDSRAGHSRARLFLGSVILGLGHSRAWLFQLSKILDTVIHIVAALVIDNTEYKSIISL